MLSIVRQLKHAVEIQAPLKCCEVDFARATGEVKIKSIERYLHGNKNENDNSDSTHHLGRRVTVVGCGNVGMACTFSILNKHFTSEVVLVDRNSRKLKGEMLDLQHGSVFMQNAKIRASTEYADTANSKVCIVTAGANQKEGESRLHLLERNVDVLSHIIPPLVQYSPDCVLLIVTNPVDVLANVAFKISRLPKTRVIGSGTNLDSSRFQFFLSKELGVAPSSVNAWIIGEHGDSSVPVWSGVAVGGVRLSEMSPGVPRTYSPEKLMEIQNQVIHSASELINLKGNTAWAVGLSVAALTSAIIRNDLTIHAISTLVKGFHGIDKEVFLSLPCMLGANGVAQILTLPLTEEEVEKLQKSADIVFEAYNNLKKRE